MKYEQLPDFIKFLQKTYKIFAPQQKEDKIFIDELNNINKLILGNQLPEYSFKRFFVPECEKLFDYKNKKLLEEKRGNGEKTALLGLNILDLKAVLLYDLVFIDDYYYQQRRKNILIIAHDVVPEDKNNLSKMKFSGEILDNFPYDIFLTKDQSQKLKYEESKDYKIVAGSPQGKEILNKFGYGNYLDKSMRTITKPSPNEMVQKIKEVMLSNKHPEIWEELGKKCIECGKCTLVCPTCFCFRIDDQPSLEPTVGQRTRCWDSCFYQEFSEISGGFKFLKTTAQRIHYWYMHKFGRIPEEYGMTGCVGCHRCAQVCPAGIDIEEIIKKLTRQVTEVTPIPETISVKKTSQ